MLAQNVAHFSARLAIPKSLRSSPKPEESEEIFRRRLKSQYGK